MLALLILSSSALLFFTLINLILTTLFARRMRKRRAFPAYEKLPEVAVVLSLRGSDPFLSRTLEALGSQQYPRYRVFVVVDHEQDPSWEVVQQSVSYFAQNQLQCRILESRRKTCSLKCSALVQAFEELKSTAEIMILADADTVPHRRWLECLVEPLVDPSIGVVTGCQWFAPHMRTWGSLLRRCWNTGAIVPTVVYSHPWAGACAMRVREIKDSGLAEMWTRTIVDDGPIAEAMRKLDKKIFHHPDLILVNRETCSGKFVWTYVSRMLTWSRIYENAFPLTVAHMLGTVIAAFCCFAISAIGFIQGNWRVGIWGLVPPLIYFVANLYSRIQVESAIRFCLKQRGDWIEYDTLLDWVTYVPVFAFTQLIYAWGVLSAIFRRRVIWRQATYRIDGRWQVDLIEDHPFYRDHSKLVHSDSL